MNTDASAIVEQIEAWAKSLELKAETAIVLVWQTLKPLFTVLKTDELAIVIQVIKDNAAPVIAGIASPVVEGEAMTAILSDLAARELTEWAALEPQLQTALLNALTSVLGLFSATTPAAPATTEAAAAS